MKLLHCLACGDVRRLCGPDGWTVCECGDSRGRYLDAEAAVWEGKDAILIGLANNSLEEAAAAAVRDEAAGKWRRAGHDIDAFTIPWNAPSVCRPWVCRCGREQVANPPNRPPTLCPCGDYALDTTGSYAMARWIPKRRPPADGAG